METETASSSPAVFQPPVRTSATPPGSCDRGRDLFETEAGNAAQFEHHTFEHDTEALADQTMIRVAQFQRRRDADRAQPFRQAASDAPQVGKFEAAESVPLSLFARRFATLASVFVGAIPTETGIPVHCCTVRRRSRACASHLASKPAKLRNASSIE